MLYGLGRGSKEIGASFGRQHSLSIDCSIHCLQLDKPIEADEVKLPIGKMGRHEVDKCLLALRLQFCFINSGFA